MIESIIKQTKERSTAYPGFSLKVAIELTAKLRDSLGKGPYSREEAAKAWNHNKLSGTAARKVAALVHYALLARKGNVYYQTQLAQDILMPLSDDQKGVALKIAALSPRLYEKLYERFGGQAVPSLLQNTLVREGINESVAKDVAETFIETMTYANILVNGVLLKADVDESTTPDQQISEPQNNAPAPFRNTPSHTNMNIPGHSFDFPGGIKLIIPQTKGFSDAIMDGELKDARMKLTEFAKKYSEDANTVSTDEEEEV